MKMMDPVEYSPQGSEAERHSEAEITKEEILKPIRVLRCAMKAIY